MTLRNRFAAACSAAVLAINSTAAFGVTLDWVYPQRINSSGNMIPATNPLEDIEEYKAYFKPAMDAAITAYDPTADTDIVGLWLPGNYNATTGRWLDSSRYHNDLTTLVGTTKPTTTTIDTKPWVDFAGGSVLVAPTIDPTVIPRTGGVTLIIGFKSSSGPDTTPDSNQNYIATMGPVPNFKIGLFHPRDAFAKIGSMSNGSGYAASGYVFDTKGAPTILVHRIQSGANGPVSDFPDGFKSFNMVGNTAVLDPSSAEWSFRLGGRIPNQGMHGKIAFAVLINKDISESRAALVAMKMAKLSEIPFSTRIPVMSIFESTEFIRSKIPADKITACNNSPLWCWAPTKAQNDALTGDTTHRGVVIDWNRWQSFLGGLEGYGCVYVRAENIANLSSGGSNCAPLPKKPAP